jgi:thymidylate kinase
MVILEGADLVGKTTLQRMLLDEPWFQENGYTPDHFGMLPDTFDFCHGYIDRASQRAVMDRFHVSERVYSDALRKRRMSHLDFRLVEAHLAQLGSLVVFLIQDDETIRRRAEAREEPFSIDEILKVNYYFDMYQFRYPGHCLTFKLEGDANLSQHVDIITDEYILIQNHLRRRGYGIANH